MDKYLELIKTWISIALKQPPYPQDNTIKDWGVYFCEKCHFRRRFNYQPTSANDRVCEKCGGEMLRLPKKLEEFWKEKLLPS